MVDEADRSNRLASRAEIDPVNEGVDRLRAAGDGWRDYARGWLKQIDDRVSGMSPRNADANVFVGAMVQFMQEEYGVGSAAQDDVVVMETSGMIDGAKDYNQSAYIVVLGITLAESGRLEVADSLAGLDQLDRCPDRYLVKLAIAKKLAGEGEEAAAFAYIRQAHAINNGRCDDTISHDFADVLEELTKAGGWQTAEEA